MYRLNVSITEEAAEILKVKAKRYGTTMGAMVTMMLLDSQKEESALESIAELSKKLQSAATAE